MSDQLTGYAYLTVRKFEYTDGTVEVRPVKATVKAPSSVNSDCIVVRIGLKVPSRAFEPVEAGIVTVPERDDFALVESA